MRPRRRPLSNNDVEPVVLESRVKNLLENRLHAVDFVDEQHLLVLQVSQNRSQITFYL